MRWIVRRTNNFALTRIRTLFCGGLPTRNDAYGSVIARQSVRCLAFSGRTLEICCVIVRGHNDLHDWFTRPFCDDCSNLFSLASVSSVHMQDYAQFEPFENIRPLHRNLVMAMEKDGPVLREVVPQEVGVGWALLYCAR